MKFGTVVSRVAKAAIKDMERAAKARERQRIVAERDSLKSAKNAEKKRQQEIILFEKLAKQKRKDAIELEKKELDKRISERRTLRMKFINIKY